MVVEAQGTGIVPLPWWYWWSLRTETERPGRCDTALGIQIGGPFLQDGPGKTSYKPVGYGAPINGLKFQKKNIYLG